MADTQKLSERVIEDGWLWEFFEVGSPIGVPREELYGDFASEREFAEWYCPSEPFD